MKTTKSQETLYEFVPGGGGPVTARDPAIEIFRGHIAYHLTRESIQNIVDARESIQNIVDARETILARPARAEFKLTSIKASQILDFESFKERIKACRALCNNLSDAKATRFYDKALDLMNGQDAIKVLKISDYNTKGLTGGDEEMKGNYFRLMKTIGAGQTLQGAGGNYGFGKNAYFAASHLHTFFASSFLGSGNHVFQGRMTLASHTIKDNKFQPFGYYGLPDMKPVRDSNKIPPMFLRDEADGKGTDIYVVGFNEDSASSKGKWEKPIVEAVLSNFWPAILWELLEVKVGSININSKNISALIQKYGSDWSGDDETDAGENPLPYFLAYVGGKGIKKHEFHGKAHNLKDMEFYAAVNPGFPKKVACIRKTGMVIQLPRFKNLEEYAGVFICRNDIGNELLRQTENAEHNKWDYQKVDSTDRRSFKAGIEEFKRFVRESLGKIGNSNDRKILSIAGLPDFLNVPELDGEADTSGKFVQGPGNETGTTESAIEVGISDAEVQVPARPVSKIPVVRPPQPPTPPTDEKQLPITFRSFVPESDSEIIKHVIILKGGPKKGICDLRIRAGTEDSFDNIEISSAFENNGKEYHVGEDNIIRKVRLGSDGTARISIIFKDNEKYSLNVTAYESQ